MSIKTITVKLETWQKITKLKADYNVRSLDDVIMRLVSQKK